MAYEPAIHIPVTVTASNRWIDFVSTATYAVSVATGSYSNLWSLASAVQTAINASTAAITVTATLASSGGVYGKFVITGDQTWSLKFATGAHASSCMATLLGFSAADTSTVKIQTATYQAPGAWFPTRAPARDSYDRRKHVGGRGREAISGAAYKRLTVATPRYRTVEFDLLPPEVVLARSATSTDLNRDFETVWRTVIAGQSFQYFTTRTSTTADATYYMHEPSDMMDIRRPHVDSELYSFELEMMRKE